MQRQAQPLHICDCFNVFIRALNLYMLANRDTVARNAHGRAQAVAEFVILIMQASDARGMAAFDFRKPAVLNEIRPEQLSHLTIYQLFGRTGLMLEKISTRLQTLKTGFTGRSDLRDNLRAALPTGKRILEAVKAAVRENRELNLQHAKEIDNSESALFRLPAEIWEHIMLFSSSYSLLKFRRASTYCNFLVDSERLWRTNICRDYAFTGMEAQQLKRPDESWLQLYFRIGRMDDLCMRIRELERSIMIQISREEQASAYKQSIESHQNDLREGLNNGEKNMGQKLTSLIDQYMENLSRLAPAHQMGLGM